MEVLPTGVVFLRQDADRWGVVAAVTDGLSLASVERDATGIRGTARSGPGVGESTAHAVALLEQKVGTAARDSGNREVL